MKISRLKIQLIKENGPAGGSPLTYFIDVPVNLKFKKARGDSYRYLITQPFSITIDAATFRQHGSVQISKHGTIKRRATLLPGLGVSKILLEGEATGYVTLDGECMINLYPIRCTFIQEGDGLPPPQFQRIAEDVMVVDIGIEGF